MHELRASIRVSLLRIDGVIESAGIFGEGDAFWVNGTQIGNWRSERELELRLTKAVVREHRAELRADPRVKLRGASDWVSITLTSGKDVALVAELGELAAAAHRSPGGGMPKPPPTGADLERRRRFH